MRREESLTFQYRGRPIFLLRKKGQVIIIMPPTT